MTTDKIITAQHQGKMTICTKCLENIRNWCAAQSELEHLIPYPINCNHWEDLAPENRFRGEESMTLKTEEQEKLLESIKAKIAIAEKLQAQSFLADLYSGGSINSNYTCTPPTKWERFKSWLYLKTWKIRGCYNVIVHDSCLACENIEED